MAEKPESTSFLQRWSRRKRGLEEEEAGGLPPETVEAGEAADAGREEDASVLQEAKEPAAEKDFADFDFDKLDYDSDYRQFMDKDVSQEARNKALRKLWVSNPVLANMDGLDDYCEDYTDAAVCLPKGTMKTLYQFGRGFLDDDEVAEWEALGREKKQVAEPETGEAVETPEDGATSEELAASAVDADTGPGAACAASVKQDEAEMLAEFEADTENGAAERTNNSKA